MIFWLACLGVSDLACPDPRWRTYFHLEESFAFVGIGSQRFFKVNVQGEGEGGLYFESPLQSTFCVTSTENHLGNLGGEGMERRGNGAARFKKGNQRETVSSCQTALASISLNCSGGMNSGKI